jgi:hypothetical protein
MRERNYREGHSGGRRRGDILDRDQHMPPYRSSKPTFFNRFVANISTSVSGRKLWTAPKYPTRFWRYLAEDMTSSTLKEAQDMSWPNISRYINFMRAVALTSTTICQQFPFHIPVELTHVLGSDFRPAFFQTILDVLLLVPLMVPQTPDEIVK